MNKKEMEELAKLIEHGAALIGVEESHSVFGIWCDDARGIVHADVLGLAIIAKLGIDPAKEHFNRMKRSDLLKGATDEALMLEAFGAPLGINDADFLAYLLHMHSSTPAEQIAVQLKSGKLGEW